METETTGETRQRGERASGDFFSFHVLGVLGKMITQTLGGISASVGGNIHLLAYSRFLTSWGELLMLE